MSHVTKSIAAAALAVVALSACGSTADDAPSTASQAPSTSAPASSAPATSATASASASASARASASASPSTGGSSDTVSTAPIDSAKLKAAWPKQVGKWPLTRAQTAGASESNSYASYGQNNKESIELSYNQNMMAADLISTEIKAQNIPVGAGACGEKAVQGHYICYLPADQGVVIVTNDISTPLDDLVDFTKGLPAAIGTK